MHNVSCFNHYSPFNDKLDKSLSLKIDLVDVQVHSVNWCPFSRVTVLLVFILLHFSSCSGQYPFKSYHTEEFTQTHTDVTQSQLPTAFNWIIIAVLFPSSSSCSSSSLTDCFSVFCFRTLFVQRLVHAVVR